MRLSTILIAVGLSVAPSAAAAQKPPAEAEAEAQAAPASPEEALAEMQAMVERFRADLLTPGEVVPGWNAGGADPEADLRRLGAEDHYFVTRSEEEGTTVGIMTTRRIADFAPGNWRIVDSYGSAVDSLDNPSIDFVRLSPRYVIASRGNVVRRDNIQCSDRIGHAYLYEVPGAPASENDDMAPLFFRIALLAQEGQTICSRYEGDAQSGWRLQVLLPDGRSLPQLTDASERLTIVEAAPIDRLLSE